MRMVRLNSNAINLWWVFGIWHLLAADEIQTAFREWNCICGAFYAYAEGKYGGRLAEVPDGASAAMATIYRRVEKLMRILPPIIAGIFRIRLTASLLHIATTNAIRLYN